MSYRRAWLLIDALNKHFKEPLVTVKHGGTAGGGAELTLLGHQVIRHFRAVQIKAHAAVKVELAGLEAVVKS